MTLQHYLSDTLARGSNRGCMWPASFRQELACRALEPVFETGLAESCVMARKERVLAQLCAEVARVLVSDNLAPIVACAEPPSDECIETELLGPPKLAGRKKSHRRGRLRTKGIKILLGRTNR